MTTKPVTTAVTWIVCSCGEKHRLVPGVIAPAKDDKVEYEEVSSAK